MYEEEAAVDEQVEHRLPSRRMDVMFQSHLCEAETATGLVNMVENNVRG